MKLEKREGWILRWKPSHSHGRWGWEEEKVPAAVCLTAQGGTAKETEIQSCRRKHGRGHVTMILPQKLGPAEKKLGFSSLRLTWMENLCSFTTSLALISNFSWSIDALVPKESHHSSEVACDLAAPSQALENCRECKELKKSVERTVQARIGSTDLMSK